MSIVFVTEKFEGKSRKTGEMKTFYVIKLGLQKDGVILTKSQPVLWLTQEQYDEYNSSSQN